MHQIGDKIIYGAVGVMTIVDIREETIGDISRSYYVLKATLTNSDSLTFVPADNERLVAFMHPLLSKDELAELIRRADKVEPLLWIEGNRQRTEYFKRVMESGDRLSIYAMIRAIDESEQRRISEGKKNFISDEAARQKARKLLNSEISVVFDIPEDDVDAFIKNIAE